MKTALFTLHITTFLSLLRLISCLPGQCLSSSRNCGTSQGPFFNGHDRQGTYRGYQILCANRDTAVRILLQQVFVAVSQLQTDLAPNLGSPQPPPPSPARDAFLHDVPPSTIKPILQKILLGAKIKLPRIPPTIDEDAELRPSIAKLPGRPHIVCATPETARHYDLANLDYYSDLCTQPEFGRPLAYSDFGDTLFLCPRFFTDLRTWRAGDSFCPGVSPDGTVFLPVMFDGKPAQQQFDGWQHLMLFRELVKLYLGDRALGATTTPRAVEDWNACLGLEGVDAGDNARSWVLWAAAVQQRCTEFPEPRYPSAAPNVTGLLDSDDSDEGDGSEIPDEIFQTRNFSSFVSWPLLSPHRSSTLRVSNLSDIRSAAAAALLAERIGSPSEDV